MNFILKYMSFYFWVVDVHMSGKWDKSSLNYCENLWCFGYHNIKHCLESVFDFYQPLAITNVPYTDYRIRNVLTNEIFPLEIL